MREVIDDLKSAGNSASAMRLGEEMIATSVCRHAVKANDPLRYPEVEKLIRDLLDCDLPYCCPHGSCRRRDEGVFDASGGWRIADGGRAIGADASQSRPRVWRDNRAQTPLRLVRRCGDSLCGNDQRHRRDRDYQSGWTRSGRSDSRLCWLPPTRKAPGCSPV